MYLVHGLSIIRLKDFKKCTHQVLRPKKICVFPVTQPTLIFPSDPEVFIGIQKKMKSYHTQPTLFVAIFIGFATFAVIFEAVLLFKHLF